MTILPRFVPHSSRRSAYRPGPWHAALCVIGLLMAAQVAPAQDTRRPPGWTIGFGIGGQLPTSIYDERVRAFAIGDNSSLSTQYTERLRLAPLYRLVLRYQPESSFSGFAAFQYTLAPTSARYSGGLAPPDTIERESSVWSIEAGVGIELVEWGDGRGLLEYILSAVAMHHKLDLSAGHRDAFAIAFGTADQEQLDWSDREWNAMGLGLGLEVRVPVTRSAALRLAVQDKIVGVSTAKIAEDERADVRRMTGVQPAFQFSPYTAHYPAVEIGFEYVLSRKQPRPVVRIALPPPARSTGNSAETETALGHAARGDTAIAIEQLRARVDSASDDASAWRSLALLLTPRAERDADARPEAWEVLQRAIGRNPGDTELLTAYGRLRALMARAGAAPARRPSLRLSEISARADDAGGLSLAWIVQNPGTLVRQYRLEIEVLDADGVPVPIRSRDAPAADYSSTVELAGQFDASTDARTHNVELRLQQAATGLYTARVRVTDLGTGQTIERVRGFEIR